MEEDGVIVARVLKGERDVYAVLVERYKGPIFNLAYRMTGDYHEADDLAQETFIRAYEHLGRFHREKNFLTWIYTLAINHIRNHLKKRKSTPSRQHAEGDCLENLPGGKNQEQDMISREAEMEVSAYVKKLPPDLCEALALRFYQDLSFDNIAEVLDISSGAAKMRVYRALACLKDLLGKEHLRKM